MSDPLLRDAANGRINEAACHAASDALEKSQVGGENKYWQAKRTIEAYAQAMTGENRTFDWTVKCPFCEFVGQGFQHPMNVDENPHILVRRHVEQAHPEQTFKCERRRENEVFDDNGPFKLSKVDHWGEREGKRCCSYCGSLHPDDVFAEIEKGGTLTPTDKNYKVYVSGGGSGKFYFQHFSPEQQQRFVDLMNDGKVKLAYPGHFYALPFFCKRKA